MTIKKELLCTSGLVGASLLAGHLAFAAEPEKPPIDFDASITLSEEYSSNIFATENNLVEDFITVLSPSFGVNVLHGIFSGSLGAQANLGRYQDNNSEDFNDYFVRGAGEVKVSDKLTFFGGADYAWTHEERSSPDAVNGTQPTEYQEGSGYLGVLTQFDEFTLRIGDNVRRLDFDDVPAAGGININNDDRDRVENELGARFGYKVDPDTEVFAQGIYDRRDYRSNLDDNFFDRDSDGFQFGVGVKGRRGPVSGEIKVGVLHQNYDDAAFNSVTTLDLDADLTWRAAQNLIVKGTVVRSINETTVNGASSYTATTAGVAVTHRVAADLFGNAYFSLAENDYNDVARRDYLAYAGFGVQYFFMPNFFVSGEYDYTQRLSDVAGVQFDEHAILLRVGAQWDNAFEEGEPTATVSGHGFYVGVQGADGALGTRVNGARGAGGTLTAEFGDQGLGGGVVAGYRAEIDDYVLGAELEAMLSNPDWTHIGDRRFSVEKTDQLGISVIAGRKLRGNTIFYTRGGVVSSNFESNYQRPSGLRATRDNRELGLNIGLGAEFPIAGGFSARMEYLVTAYQDYNIGASGGSGPDNFASIESQARVGLIYSFGASEPEAAPPFDFSGFYVGGQIGHGMLTSENVGPRPNAAAPSFTLNATRSGQGFTGGLVAGYGYEFHEFYAGAEVEAELSNVDWHIERDPTGRLYSVEKDWTFGVAARGGYVISDTALVYGRVGVVGSQFTTDYNVGGNNISSDDIQMGIRFGGGVELAISDSTTMRLDYTRTEYNSYSVNYNSGSDSFDHTENLFRVGVIVRF